MQPLKKQVIFLKWKPFDVRSGEYSATQKALETEIQW